MPRHQLLCRIPWMRQPAWSTLPILGLSEETNVAKVHYVADVNIKGLFKVDYLTDPVK